MTTFDSLVIANSIELLGGGVTSQNPVCLGAMFRLQPGADPGAPQPTTDFVASLILDGERPFGRRASNRTIKLPVWITAPDRKTLAAAREVLQQAIDQDIFTTTWIRDPAGGTPLPLILDCFRAQPTINTFNTRIEKSLVGVQVQLTIPALPYGRSDQQYTPGFTGSVPQIPTPPPPPSPVVLDNFATISKPVFSQSSVCVVGPFTAFWDPDAFGDFGGQVTELDYGKTFTSPLNLVNMTSLQMYLGLGSRYYPFLEYPGRTSGVGVYVTLTDTSGRTLSFSRSHLRLPVANTPQNPVFSRVTIPIPGSTTFDFTNVASYSMKIINRQDNDLRRFSWVVAYLDALTAYPSSQTASPVTRGNVYTLYGLKGTARSPVSMSFQQPPSAGTPTTITATGVGNYTVPANTAWLKIEVIGGGGAGGNAGPWGPTVLSGGGVGPIQGIPAGQDYIVLSNAQTALLGVGDTFKFTAGPNAGATVYTVQSVQPPAFGFNNIGFTPASPVTPSASDTVTGTAALGGGGGGAEYAREDVFACSPGQVIPYSVGAGGAAGATPTDGGTTTFGPGPSSTLAVIANGGKSALPNSITGGLGGTGSSNSVHHDGGAGRTASGSVGGGGGSSGGTSAPGQSPVGTAADLFTTAGAGTWTAPAGVFQVYAECWGGGASGATGGASTNGAGGGGGEYAAAFIPVTPGTVYNLTVGAGGAAATLAGTNGNDGGSSLFTGDSSQSVTAHGGTHGRTTFSGGQGAGGTGSTASVHFDGGSGGSAYPYSGGGGSSAGSATSGNSGNGYGGAGVAPADGGAGGSGSGATGNPGGNGHAPGGGGGGTFSSTTSGAGAAGQVRLTYPGGSPTNNGASAVPGGGAGGAGGGAADTGGSAGSQPGGGGGGADSATLAETGGAGGAGKLIITPYASAAFKNLIVHRPPLGAKKTFQPLVGIGGGGDPPDGTHEYRMPQPLTGLNASFGGTYTVYLVASSLSGSSTRTVSVSVNQYEYSGGPKYTATTLPVSFTPSQIINGLIPAGVITLPLRRLAADNTAGYFTVTPTDSNTADRFNDCIFLDTMGQSVIINESSSGYVTYYTDEPEPNLALGNIMGTQNGRGQAISVLDAATVSGPAIAVEPSEGDNQLFCYSADGSAPVISVAYYPRWYFDRFE